MGVDQGFDNYLPPMVEPGCGGYLEFKPCASDGAIDISTLFDIIQTPLMGVVVGSVLYFQIKNQQGLKRPAIWAVASGIAASAVYGAYKFLL